MRDCGLVSTSLVSKIINIAQLLTAYNYNVSVEDTEYNSFVASKVSTFLLSSIDLVDSLVQRGIKTKFSGLNGQLNPLAVATIMSGILIDDLEVKFNCSFIKFSNNSFVLLVRLLLNC